MIPVTVSVAVLLPIRRSWDIPYACINTNSAGGATEPSEETGRSGLQIRKPIAPLALNRRIVTIGEVDARSMGANTGSQCPVAEPNAEAPDRGSGHHRSGHSTGESLVGTPALSPRFAGDVVGNPNHLRFAYDVFERRRAMNRAQYPQ
jgi:hypothetical protein